MNGTMTSKTTHRPPARKPRSARVYPPLRARDAYQVGRVRAWLSRNAGLLCLALGWAVSIAIVYVPKGDAAAVVELGLAGAALLGFGVGWIVRGERGGR